MSVFLRQEHDAPFPNSRDEGRTAPTPEGASGPTDKPIAILAYLDIVLVVLAAPIMILIGVPAGGYAIGAGAWVALRALGVGVERVARVSDARTQISLRMGYMLGRLFALAIAVILARQSEGKDGGLTALAVVVFAFTIQLGTSAVNRPRSR